MKEGRENWIWVDRTKENKGGGKDWIWVEKIKENEGERRGLDMGGQD